MPRPMENMRRCHVCNEDRQSSKISVHKHKTRLPGTNTLVEEQVNYCNDKAECTSAAPKVSFVRPHTPTVATRNRRPVGQ